MTDAERRRLEKLEVLYSEQEYTVQTLNTMVAQQEREIARLGQSLALLDEQLRSLRAGLGENLDSGDEKPPHY